MLVLNGNLSETSQPVSSHCSQSAWFQSSCFSSYFPVVHFFLSARLHCSGHWSFSSCRMSKAGPIHPLPSPEDTGNSQFSGQLLLLFPQILSYHSPLKTQGLFWTQWLSLHQQNHIAGLSTTPCPSWHSFSEHSAFTFQYHSKNIE